MRRARKAGILWIQSAGNEATDHWSGKLADANKDHFIDMNGTTESQFDDPVQVEPGGVRRGNFLQWDQWPTSSAQLALDVIGYQCTDTNCSRAADQARRAATADNETLCEVQAGGTAPVLASTCRQHRDSTRRSGVVRIEDGAALPSTRYDITYQGEVDPNGFSFENPDRAAAGSMASPADSPYALAVGAADVGGNNDADGVPPGTLEDFSSRGPTLDGRTKPDITAWDGVSSPEYGQPSATDVTTGFYGTSAAAPHVAGAAALVKSANTSLDAAQVQNFLEQRANHGAPDNPPTNGLGHGLLTLGATPTQTPVVPDVGSRYQPLTPERLLDTRTPTGGHHSVLGAKASLTLTVPNLPDDATAVAINLTGTGAKAGTVLTAYPGGTAVPSTSNVNLSATDSTAASFAVVTLGANHTIAISNSSSPVNVVVDLLGYFGTASAQGLYAPLATPTRVLDTRTTTGGHHAQLAKGGAVSVDPAAPAGATAAVVNLTATRIAGGGFLSAAPTCTSAVST